jgi:hypothetical protein
VNGLFDEKKNIKLILEGKVTLRTYRYIDYVTVLTVRVTDIRSLSGIIEKSRGPMPNQSA